VAADQERTDLAAALPFVTLDGLRACPSKTIIDLRAPLEFEADRIPGAVSAPLFENETRSIVGLLYKQFSPEAAFQEGRAAVHGRIESLVAEIAAAIGWTVPDADLGARVLEMTRGGIAKLEGELEPSVTEGLPPGAVVFTCARGGLRSRSVVALMRSLGLETAFGLHGGYRAHRQDVLASLESWTPPARVFALRGLTGVGKTLVLRAIEARRPGWTLDLEGIAGHRSSLLGMVGLNPTSQKAFETGLAARLRAGFPDGVMIMEGESRKVGDAVIPLSIWSALQAATNVEVVASVARRVRVLSEDYLADPSALPLLRTQLEAVSARMEGAPDLAGMLDRGQSDALVEQLLARYYDPLYTRSESGKAYELSVEAESEIDAAERVIAWVEARAG
jgi:tRNA 2-selenouridine synthase